MHRSFSSIRRITAILAMGSAALIAQGTQTANITGQIVDDSRVPLAGATIRLSSPSMQGTRTLVSDEKGRFVARLLPTGTYLLEVWKTGFQTVKVSERLYLDQNYQPTIVLPKSAGATVEVVAAATGVDKTDVKTASNFQLDAVDELPTVNRTMETIAALAPGVNDQGVGQRIQIRGAMTSGNLFLLDGQNIADSVYGNRGISIIEDSIDEVQIITGAISAEYGNVDGGVLNSTTRSGSNSWDGQLRWELSNPAWNAVRPLQKQNSNNNLLGQTYTLSLGGPIIKDKLWFHLSYFRNTANSNQYLSGGSSSPTDAGAAYTFMQNEIRKQIKLTYAINENHTFVAAFMDNSNTQTPRNYSAGELSALEHQLTTGGFYSLALRSVWSPTVTSELRYGQKREALYAGAINMAADPIYEDASGFFYNAGIFNYDDGGDHRNNRTFNAKVSLFWDAAGSHQTDLGFDFYRGLRRAANMQATNNRIFEVAGIGVNSIPGDVNTPESVWTFISDPRQVESDSYGLYVNDKWSLNKNWSFQIGLRFDKYSAKDTNGGSTVSATGFSPRLGLNWDILGDSVWIGKLSWARYNSGVADQIAGQVTNSGNPTEVDYYYKYFNPNTGALVGDPNADANGNVPISVATNIANYSMTPGNVAYYSNPTVNVKLASGLKSPHVDETQASIAYSFKNEVVGTGYLRLTAVNKVWGDLFDYTAGNNGTTQDQFGSTYYWKIWENSPDAKRKYKDLEFEAQTTLNGWTVNFNSTWSDLEGNYQGEGTSTPFAGQGINYFTVLNGVKMFDPSVNNPYGKLTGDTPLRMRGTLSKVVETSWGKTTWGFIYRFDSGQHFSYTRTVPAAALNPALAGTGFGTTATQYLNGQRGAGIYYATSFIDMALTQDFKLGEVSKTPVFAFVKLNVQNVLNHQQLWQPAYNYRSAGSLTAAWVPAAGFGAATNSGNYAAARTILVSAGVRF